VTEEGDFYYVMEFLNGLDWDSLVTRFGPVDPRRAVFLLSQACMSLGEAHLAGLVHRDVKPANLFTCRLGPHYDFVKLLDFGIVRSTAGAGQTVTSPGQLKGTPTSFPPEVVEGGQAGYAADIYGLGCVAYWLIAGQHVFEAPTIMSLLVKHASKAPEPLSQHRSDVPGELDELVLRCLAKDPADRPASAFELAECLAAIPFEAPWDNQFARAWWETNIPAATRGSMEEAVAETMFIKSGDTK
jgi:serine/threonine-protein kinase